MAVEHHDLEITGAFDAEQVFGFFAHRAIDGVEAVTKHLGQWRYARTLTFPAGPAALAVTHAGERLRVSVRAPSRSEADQARATAHKLFDLEAPIGVIDDVLRRDPALSAQVRRRPGIRLPGAHDLHELLIRAIVGQQIAVPRARAHLNRLTGALGTPYNPPDSPEFAGLTTIFPPPHVLASSLRVPGPNETLDPHRILRLPRRSIGAVVAASQAYVDGSIDLPRLTDLPGVGPWTAAYVRMRYAEERDVWLRGDVALVAGAKRLGILTSDLLPKRAHAELETYSEAWRPWRAYAAMRLWSAEEGDGERRVNEGATVRPST